MRRFTLAGLMLISAAACAAALSASASALELPENLPASTTRTWTGKNVGVTTFFVEGQEPIECTAAKSEGTETSSKSPKGAFTVHFEGCTTKAGGVSVKCTGLGQASGVFIESGTWALVFDRLIARPFENLTSALLFNYTFTHYTCGGLVLEEWLAGEMLCLHLNATTKSSTHESSCAGETAKPKSTGEWGKDVGGVFTGGKVPLATVSVNHATSLPAIQIGKSTTEYKEEVFADQ